MNKLLGGFLFLEVSFLLGIFIRLKVENIKLKNFTIFLISLISSISIFIIPFYHLIVPLFVWLKTNNETKGISKKNYLKSFCIYIVLAYKYSFKLLFLKFDLIIKSLIVSIKYTILNNNKFLFSKKKTPYMKEMNKIYLKAYIA
ncbi:MULTISPECIES: hypothetical protein [Fusobacterium]|uniref:Uncharacterized protein n=1 Tax=Fusobacterium vincentii TaxID=155615 RepID=A0AAJ1CS37_FUSVC|nr:MULTISPECIES: hypothetical protein [Fusobacterium]ERT44428.1 hypothetical protein HMPREF1768_01960 [Fusobacterium nucleatum CTI-7]MCW0263082.1 hypothetical protein [Fusobacterium vincentii]STO29913.1 Uncharacterised protein [Fusobacterium vincentii]